MEKSQAKRFPIFAVIGLAMESVPFFGTALIALTNVLYGAGADRAASGALEILFMLSLALIAFGVIAFLAGIVLGVVQLFRPNRTRLTIVLSVLCIAVPILTVLLLELFLTTGVIRFM